MIHEESSDTAWLKYSDHNTVGLSLVASPIVWQIIQIKKIYLVKCVTTELLLKPMNWEVIHWAVAEFSCMGIFIFYTSAIINN